MRFDEDNPKFYVGMTPVPHPKKPDKLVPLVTIRPQETDIFPSVKENRTVALDTTGSKSGLFAGYLWDTFKRQLVCCYCCCLRPCCQARKKPGQVYSCADLACGRFLLLVLLCIAFLV